MSEHDKEAFTASEQGLIDTFFKLHEFLVAHQGEDFCYFEPTPVNSPDVEGEE